MRPLLPLLVLATLLSCLPAGAEPPATRARALLSAMPDPASLRAALVAYADSVADHDPEGAAEALQYAGTSYQREGRVDSAIVCHRRAVRLGPVDERVTALVDQLLIRRASGDATEAITRLEAAIGASEQASPLELVARLGWAQYLKGDVETAWATVAPLERRLADRPGWRYRLGRLALDRRDYRQAVTLLLPQAVRSRGMEEDVIGMLQKAGQALGIEPRLKSEVQRMTDERDRADVALAQALGGRLVALHASDGFPLGGLLVPAPKRAGAARPRLAIVLLAPGDTLADADSLVSAFRRHGLATLVLQPRGHGASVAPSCPSPDAWFDREAAIEARIARDVPDAVRGLRGVIPFDTTRYVVGAAGASASMAIEAARLDRRVRALLLVSPAPEPVERGQDCARLAASGVPAFLQVGADDIVASTAPAEAFYQAGNRAASRVVEAAVGGSRLAQFRNDPRLAARLLEWLDATLPASSRPRPARAAPRPTPPTPRR